MDTTEQIARNFSTRLLARLGAYAMQEINRRNASAAYSDGACATHDYCDANVVMSAAMSEALGVTEDYLVDNLNDETLLRQWEDAWQLARGAGFYMPKY